MGMNPGVTAVVIFVSSFVFSLVVLFVFTALTVGGKATGLIFWKLNGITFMCVGGLYFLAGLIMRFAIR